MSVSADNPTETGKRSGGNPPPFFVTGGTVPPNAVSYIERQADKDLLSALLGGEFAYVLNTRQMGKSSLCARTITRLQQHGVRTVFLDLTKIGGQNATPDQWYAGLLSETGRQLELRKEFLAYFRENADKTQVMRFFGSLREIAVEQISEPIVLLIDEIDAVRSLPFPADEFFTAIRACYNERIRDTAYQRLTFCLFGVATPADLISDTRLSPFNIGQRIRLNDFTPDEARPLAGGLPGGQPILDRVLYWTNGHPYLTQRLCRAIAESVAGNQNETESFPSSSPPSLTNDHRLPTTADVDRLCDALFLSKSAQESDDNISFVRNRLLRSEADLASLLDLFRQVRTGKRVKDDETNPLCAILRLSGVCRVEGDSLKIRNRIYAHVFDKAWVESHMPDAEKRRQRAAFRKGMALTGAISGIVFAVVGALFGIAQQERARADLLRIRAEGLAQKAQANLQGRMKAQAEANTSMRQAQQSAAEAKESANRANAQAQRADREKQRALAAEKTAKEQAKRAAEATHTAQEQAALARRAAMAEKNTSRENRANLYISQTRQAQQAIIDGQIDRAAELLNAQIPKPGEEDRREFTWRYFQEQLRDQSLGDLPIKEVVGAEAVGVSPDGKRIAVSHNRGTVSVFDAVSGARLRSFRAANIPIKGLQFAGENRTLVTFDGSTAVAVWDIATGKKRYAIAGTPGDSDIPLVTPDGKHLILFAPDYAVEVWDTATGTQAARLPGKDDGNELCIARNGRTIGIRRFTSAEVWDWVDNRLSSDGNPAGLQLDKDATRIALSPDGRLLAVGGSRPEVRFVAVGRLPLAGRRVALLSPQERWTNDLAFSHDGKTLVYGGDDALLHLWDVETRTERAALRGHRSAIGSVRFVGETNEVISGSAGLLKRWNVTRTSETLRLAPGVLRKPLWSMDFQCVVYREPLSRDLKLTNMVTGQTQMLRSPKSNEALQPLHLSADNTKLYAYGLPLTGRAGRRNDTCGLPLYIFDLPNKTMQQVAVSKSADTRFRHFTASTASYSDYERRTDITMLTYYDAKSGRRLGEILLSLPITGAVSTPFGDAMETQTLSDDKNFLTHFLLPGRRSALLIRLEPSRLHVIEYDFAAKKSVTRLSLPEEAFAGFTISDDKRWLAVTSYEQKAILLYDLSSGTMRFRRRIPVDGIDNARFLNGGQWIAAGTNDKTMRLWETKTGTSIGVLRGHTDNPKYPSLSPDGRTIATCGTELERSVRLWDTRLMQEIAVFRLPERVKAARFTQDGSALLVMDVKNVLTVFRAGAAKTAPTESRSRVAHQ